MSLIFSENCCFSEDMRYRYALVRKTAYPSDKSILFVLLNPSTADDTKDDPTIRRLRGFAESFGFGRMTVANLFAFRATSPEDMKAAEDPVGEDNKLAITTLVFQAGMVICGWGAHGTCLSCNAVIDKIHGAYCPACLLFMLLIDAPDFDGTYPVFIGDKFIESEEELIAYVAEEKLDLRRTLLQTAHPNYPRNISVADIECLFDDMLFEDQTLPDPVHEACVAFRAALSDIKDPISWTAYDNLRFSEEQIQSYTIKIEAYKKEKESHAEKA